MTGAWPPSRFGVLVLVIGAALALATVGVLARGDQVNVEPVAVAPAPAAVGVSTGARLHIRFARPMQPASVEGRLTIEPPTPGSFTWAGSTVIFTPDAPLRADTDYRVRLDTGLEEARGRRSRAPYSWGFRTGAPSLLALRRQGGATNLWAIDPATGAARQVTSHAVDVADFQVAPEGDRVAYTLHESPNRTTIWQLDLRSGAARRLSPEEDASFAAPAWSPGGDLLLVERRQAQPGVLANPKIFALRPDGASGGMVYGRGDEVGFGARWSPDGARVAFFDSVRSAVIVFNFTRDVVAIPVTTTVAFAWSPDGRQVVIEDIVTEGNAFRHVLLLADTRAGQVTRLPTPGEVDVSAPAWSPDGRQIAYLRRGRVGAIGGHEPWVLNLADGGTRRLNLPADPDREVTRLVWAPDSAHLVVNQWPRTGGVEDAEIWLLPVAEGEAARRLTEGLAPAWRP